MEELPTWAAILSGAFVGVPAGALGGFVAAAVSWYSSPVGQMLEKSGRLQIAIAVGRISRRTGAIAGVVSGGVGGAVTGVVGLLVAWLVVSVVFGAAAVALLWDAEESADGFVSGALGGVALGVLGGYLARGVAAHVWSLL